MCGLLRREWVLYRRTGSYDHFRRFLITVAPDEAGLENVRRVRAEVRGRIPNATRAQRHLAILDAHGITADADVSKGRAALDRNDAAIERLPGAAFALNRLQTAGYALGVITNTSASTIDKQRWRRACGLDIAWTASVSSCEVGARKPDARIYEIALQRCRVEASAAAFVGHDVDELAGAHRIGMHTIGLGCDASVDVDMRIYSFADLPAVLAR